MKLVRDNYDNGGVVMKIVTTMDDDADYKFKKGKIGRGKGGGGCARRRGNVCS